MAHRTRCRPTGDRLSMRPPDSIARRAGRPTRGGHRAAGLPAEPRQSRADDRGRRQAAAPGLPARVGYQGSRGPTSSPLLSDGVPERHTGARAPDGYLAQVTDADDTPAVRDYLAALMRCRTRAIGEHPMPTPLIHGGTAWPASHPLRRRFSARPKRAHRGVMVRRWARTAAFQSAPARAQARMSARSDDVIRLATPLGGCSHPSLGRAVPGLSGGADLLGFDGQE